MRTKNFIHIVQTIFTGKEDTKNIIDNGWLKNRIEIFKSYTLKSLINQSNRDFFHWLIFRPEEEDNFLVRNLMKFLEALKYKSVFTFHSSPYFGVHQTQEEIESLNKRLEDSLKIVKIPFKLEKNVYLTVIDSDDLYHREAIEEIQKFSFEPRRALYFTKGYILDISLNKLAEWDPTTCPPFYTILQSTETFFDAKKHLQYRRGLVFHKHLPKVFQAIPLEGRKFMYGIHGLNDSTFWNNPYRGQEILDEKIKQSILKDFGLEHVS